MWTRFFMATTYECGRVAFKNATARDFFLKSVATWNFFVCLFFSSWLARGCASQASGLTYLRPIPLKVCRGIFNVCESHTFGEHMPPISSFKVCGPYCRYFQLYIQNGELAYMYSNCGSWNCHFKLHIIFKIQKLQEVKAKIVIFIKQNSNNPKC